jgi:hypothetical protein
MRDRGRGQRASRLEQRSVLGCKRPSQGNACSPLWNATGRADEDWSAPVSFPGRGTGTGGTPRPTIPHAAPHGTHYFFRSTPRHSPTPAAMRSACHGLARTVSSRLCSTVPTCWRPCR